MYFDKFYYDTSFLNFISDKPKYSTPTLLVKQKLNIIGRLINTYRLCCYLSSVRIDLRFRNVIKF